MELSQYLLLVLLGMSLGNVQQIDARGGQLLSCNKTQYQNEKLNICCSRCPPGHYRNADCTPTADTLCLPCRNGTFASKWNSATTCRTCYPCSPHLVEKTPCNATQATVCVCPDGYSCTQYDALNVCQICTPDKVLVPTESIPTESPPGHMIKNKKSSESFPQTEMADMKTIWIIVGLVLFIVAASVVVLCVKTTLLRRFGHMIKNKKRSESFPQTEMAVDNEVVIGLTYPFLEEGQKKMPSQEDGKHLNYPIQESSTTEIGESTLIPKRME